MHVTILIPAFNTQHYIAEAIQSALAQSHKDFDILVVDDGSTDQTAAVVRQFIGGGHPVSLLQNEKNKGVTHATHIGITAAEGPIVTILDSDDTLMQHSLRIGSAPFANPEVGFVWSRFQKSSGSIGWSRDLPGNTSLWQAMMYHHWWKASHQRFLRKQTYMDGVHLNTDIKRSSDFQLVLLLGLSGCKTIHVPVVTYWYRMGRKGSITSEGSHLQRRAVEEIKQWIIKELRARRMDEPA